MSIPAGVLGQVYLLCTTIGAGYLLVSVFTGQLGSDGDDGGLDLGDSDDGGGAAESSGAQHNSLLPEVISKPRRRFSLLSAILGLLSPMSLAVSLLFFGLGGLLAAYANPAFGPLTLIPAVLLAFVVRATFRMALRALLVHGESSSHALLSDFVGQTAEVITPISDGRMGEVKYVVGSKLFQSPAQAAKTGETFSRGSKVIIVEAEPHRVSVEAWTEF